MTAPGLDYRQYELDIGSCAKYLDAFSSKRIGYLGIRFTNDETQEGGCAKTDEEKFEIPCYRVRWISLSDTELYLGSNYKTSVSFTRQIMMCRGSHHTISPIVR